MKVIYIAKGEAVTLDSKEIELTVKELDHGITYDEMDTLRTRGWVKLERQEAVVESLSFYNLPDKINCPNCGHSVSKYEFYPTENDDVCEDCIYHYHECTRCGVMTHDDHGDLCDCCYDDLHG